MREISTVALLVFAKLFPCASPLLVFAKLFPCGRKLFDLGPGGFCSKRCRFSSSSCRKVYICLITPLLSLPATPLLSVSGRTSNIH